MGCLRLFLAMSVVVYHLPDRPFSLMHAGMAVITFFMISGFYMSLVINEKYSLEDNWVSKFYVSRILRLYPAYFAVAGSLILWSLFRSSPLPMTDNLGLTFAEGAAISFINLFIIGQDIFQVILESTSRGEPHFQANADVFKQSHMLIGQAWTLSSELFFYALAPFVVRRISVLLLVGTLSMAIRFYFDANDAFVSGVWTYYFFPSTVTFFILGCLSYHFYRSFGHRLDRRFGLAAAAGVASFMVYLTVFGGGIYQITMKGGYDTTELWAYYLAMFFAIPLLFDFTKRNKWDRQLGELSYPLYLCHGIIIGTIFFVLFPKAPYAVRFLLAVGGSLAVSVLIYKYIDRPMDRFRHGLKNFSWRFRYSWVLAAALVVVPMSNSYLVNAQEPPVPPPILVEVIGKYNLIHYDDLFYGIPHGLPVDWDDKESRTNARIIIGSKDEVTAALSRRK